jgi:hypothetical protein
LLLDPVAVELARACPALIDLTTDREPGSSLGLMILDIERVESEMRRETIGGDD